MLLFLIATLALTSSVLNAPIALNVVAESPQPPYYRAKVINKSATISSAFSLKDVISYRDLNGDGVNEIYIAGRDSSGNLHLCFVDGLSLELWSCMKMQPFVEHIYAIAPIADLTGDGIRELITFTIERQSGITVIRAFSVDPLRGNYELRDRIAINRLLGLSTIHWYGYYATMYKNNTIELIYAELDPANPDPRKFATIIMTYDVETGSLDYREVQAKIYTMYTSEVLEDVDGDGVLKLTNRCRAVALVERIESGETQARRSSVNVHCDGMPSLERSSSDVVYLSLALINNSLETIFLTIEYEIARSAYHFVGYRADGSEAFRYTP